jgi:hypothetical protein
MYTFDIRNITMIARQGVKAFNYFQKQRRNAMKISQSVTHFFNYQRMNVKKKYHAEL